MNTLQKAPTNYDMELSSSQHPTTKEALQIKKATLEVKLEKVNKALKFFEENPKIEEGFTLLQQTI
jgi:hypothetical protein